MGKTGIQSNKNCRENISCCYRFDGNLRVKMKFEIYATRKTEKGEDQKSATSKQTIIVK